MSVLLVVYGYESAFPFIQNIERELIASGVETDVLDLTNFHIKSGEQYHAYFPAFFRRFVNVRILGTALITMSLKWLSRTRRVRYDAVSIQSCDRIHIYAIPYLKQISENISGAVWGSDFYRISDQHKEDQRRLYDELRYIVFGNPQNAGDFFGYYKTYREKLVITGFGVSLFAKIDEVNQSQSAAQIRSALNLPVGKKTVAIGYNGREMQQHDLIIRQLFTLREDMKQQLHLVIQSSYGADAVYMAKVNTLLAESGISYTVIQKFMSNAEVGALRCATDIVLNAQVSDGFSGSIQEAIYAESIVIAGDWLPYRFLEAEGIHLILCAKDAFAHTLTNILEHYPAYKASIQHNKENIRKYSGWETKIKKWNQVFTGDVQSIKF